MIALTTVTKNAYKSLLEDATHPMEELQEKYGAGFFMRLQGIVTALAVRDFVEEYGEYKTADALYEDILEDGFVQATFEINNLESVMPKGALLESMIYSMCQAQTGDYN